MGRKRKHSPLKFSFSGAQNSSYSGGGGFGGGDGRFSALSSSREEKLVGSHLNLSHPLYRNCRFCSMHPCVWDPFFSPSLFYKFPLGMDILRGVINMCYFVQTHHCPVFNINCHMQPTTVSEPMACLCILSDPKGGKLKAWIFSPFSENDTL